MNNSIKNRYELVFFIEAKNCNYNGDPDFDNLPRIDYETNKGYMTDVSIKRKIRDYISDAYEGIQGYEIFVRNGQNLNKSIAECYQEVAGDEKIEKGKNVQQASDIAKKRFWDVRTFGAVMSTGLNAGQIQGTVQIGIASSYDEVKTNSISITRLAYAEGEHTDIKKYDEADAKLDESKKRTIGKKTFANYALFECHVFISANLAKKNGFSENDLNALLEAISNMFNYQTSASKAGMSLVGPIVLFKHVGNSDNNNIEQKQREAMLGCCSAQKLFKLINVKKKDDIEFPRTCDDYNAYIDLHHLPNGVEVGFKYEAFENIEWGVLRKNEWLKEL